MESLTSSSWFLLAAGIALGMLLERWHMIRVVDKHRRMRDVRREAAIQLAVVQNWMRSAGTPQPVLERVDWVAGEIVKMGDG